MAIRWRSHTLRSECMFVQTEASTSYEHRTSQAERWLTFSIVFCSFPSNHTMNKRKHSIHMGKARDMNKSMDSIGVALVRSVDIVGICVDVSFYISFTPSDKVSFLFLVPRLLLSLPASSTYSFSLPTANTKGWQRYVTVSDSIPHFDREARRICRQNF